MATLAEMNKTRWDNAHISTVKGPEFKAVADKINLYKNKYVEVQKKTGVPWWFIGCVHYRESNFDFSTYLGNGQALNKVTTIVPKGRGPFATWEEGAVDALQNCPPYAARNKDWSVGKSLEMLEKYNGLGYFNKGKPSPYIWSGTDQYVSGKYVSDGKYSPNVVDKQLGVAGVLKFLGVFKAAPVGTGTATVAGTVIAGGAAAAADQSWWMWATDHWFAILLGAAAVAFVVDFAIAIINNEKNQLKVKDVPVVK